MLKTESIVKHDSDMEVKYLPINEIYVDSEFNCRGDIAPIDVVDLAKSIESVGLQSPVSVQLLPANLNKPDLDRNVHKYRLVMGHRRLTACKILKYKTIPAFVKTELTDVQAQILNLQENLERKDLNKLQEAKAIEKFKRAGYTLAEVAKLVGMSTGWVQIRYNLLELEPEIQQAAAADLITQEQIKDLYSLPNKEQRFEAVKRIKDSRLRGDKKAIKIKEPKRNILAKRPRQREEIFEMITHIIQSLGAGLHTRTLAWAAGEINTLELYQDIKEEAAEKGIVYTIPRETLVG